jgi:hypothetical protein
MGQGAALVLVGDQVDDPGRSVRPVQHRKGATDHLNSGDIARVNDSTDLPKIGLAARVVDADTVL